MGLSKEKILFIFKETGAFLQGHFILSSGLHSDTYFQCAKVLQYPWHSELFCKEIVNHFRKERIDVIVSPAIGGIVVGQEVARLLGVRAIFTEREESKMALRRGFEISAGEHVLVVEDVTTTGGSVQEVIEVARNSGGCVIAVTSIVDRSEGNIQFNIPFFSLFQMKIRNYPLDSCPLCQSGSIAVKPGSRGLK